MVVGLQGIVAQLRNLSAELDPSELSAGDAPRMLQFINEAERVLAALRIAVAKRIEESNCWSRDGHRSAESFLALATGTTLGEAGRMLDTAHRLSDLPGTVAALVAGKISESQATQVADAATAAPGAEKTLLDLATRSTHKALADECRRVKAAATDDDERYERTRKNRFLKRWTDADGAACGMFKTTPDAGARIFGAIDAELDKVFAEARKAGRHEPIGAYAIDALERLVTSGAGEAKTAKQKWATTVNVLIDYAALLKNATAAGEVCEIPGLGPVPVSLVKEWLNDAYLRVIVTDGIDIKAVTRKTRYIDQNQRIALAVRESFTCAIEHCDADRRLELDHLVDYAKDGPTEVDNLVPLCHFHHMLKTLKKYRLVGGPGRWRLEPP